MKREILFRGLARDGKWYYGDLLWNDMGCRIVYVENIPPSWQEPGGDTKSIYQDVNFETIGEFSGLKDKNNQGIFEGDIVKYYGIDFGEMICTVDFDCCSFVIKNDNMLHTPLGNAKRDYIEVIGNVYEHPNLIEQ